MSKWFNIKCIQCGEHRKVKIMNGDKLKKVCSKCMSVREKHAKGLTV